MASQSGQRLVYRNAYRSMLKAGVNPAQAILTQSYLRLERTLSTSSTSYQFGVLVNDQPGGSAIRANEVRLNLQDAFYVSSIAMYVSITANSTDTNNVYRTYPNPRIFTTPADTALYQLYNGYLSLTVNNRVITSRWALSQHLLVPQTQLTNTAVNNAIDQFDGQNYGDVPCEPNWVLIGSKNNNLTVTLPNAVSSLVASNTTVVTFVLSGVLAQNATQVS